MNLAPQSVPRIVDNRLLGYNGPRSSEAVRSRKTPMNSTVCRTITQMIIMMKWSENFVKKFFWEKREYIYDTKCLHEQTCLLEKKYDLNNVSVRKIEDGPGTEPEGRRQRARGETDLAWRKPSPFHKSGVPLETQTHLRGSTI